MSVAFHDLYRIVGFTDGQPAAFAASFAAPINRDKEIVATAFHVERNLPIVVDDDRAYIETVWSDWGDGDGVAMRHDNRSAYAE